MIVRSPQDDEEDDDHIRDSFLVKSLFVLGSRFFWFIGLFRGLALLSRFSLEQEASDGKQRTVPALA
ncbi:MAG: hypothetical protein ABIU05_06670, partial [Nitrospirales bacterium]